LTMAKDNQKKAQDQKGEPKWSKKEKVTPTFNVASEALPTVKVNGKKQIRECLLITVMQPGKSTCEGVTIHRPVGVTTFDPMEEWVGTYSTSLDSLIASAKNDEKRVDTLFNQRINELLADKKLVVQEMQGDRRVITYPAEAVQGAKAFYAKAGRWENSDDDDLPLDAEEATKAFRELLETVPEGSGIERNLVKKSIEDYLEPKWKDSDTYKKYLKDLHAYQNRPKKKGDQRPQPTAPRNPDSWEMYLPTPMKEAEELRDVIRKEHRRKFILRNLKEGRLGETVEPMTRQRQIPISLFHGKDFHGMKTALFDLLHFGEINIPGQGGIATNTTQPAPVER